MRNKKPAKFINVDLPSGARQIKIPAGLRLITLSDDFERSVFDVVVPHLMSSRAKIVLSWVVTERGFSGSLEFTRSNGILYWGVRQGGPYLACGFFYLSGKYWRETRAAAAVEVRGQGLYSAVLRQLRRDVKKPLVSDRQLSLANLIIWSAIGVIDEEEGGFRINQVGKRQVLWRSAEQYAAALSVAKSIIAVEVA